ncbi:MAG: hypothetical protein KKI09_12485 [Spirochaetes bacterium]|nr:hypothetical protein [Spirochaetota bacterium]MBU0956239.1 hypothetical protein [Spirochaetota bacterium]
MNVSEKLRNFLPGVVLLGMFSLVSISAAFAEDSASTADSLWQKANQDWRLGQTFQAHRMRIVADELDKRGQIDSTTITDLAMRYVGEQTFTEVLNSSKDGRDTTAKTRADYAKRDGSQNEGPMDPMDFIPFSATVSEFLRRGPAAWVGGVLSVPYEITKPKSGSEGILFFSAQGSPEYLEYSMKPLPPLVSHFRGEIHFLRLPEGALVISGMRFDAEGGILLIRKRYAIRMEFSDYRRP